MARDTLATGTSRKYIAHPAAAAAATFVSDGKPLDAGTWHIFVNNSHVLLAESHRQLFSDRIGATTKATDRGWDALDETAPPSADRSVTGSFDLISWNLLGTTPTARRYGPFPMLSDRSVSTTAGTENLPRRVRFHARYYSDGTNAYKLYIALTAGPEPPTSGVIAADTSTFTTTSASDQDGYVTFDYFAPTPPRSRTTGTTTERGVGFVAVPEFWVWVGWDMNAVTGTAGIRCVEAWEWVS